jgi:hypothetical protein
MASIDTTQLRVLTLQCTIYKNSLKMPKE